MPRQLAACGVLVLVALLGTACGSGEITALAAGDVLAALTVIDTDAAHRPADGEGFRAAVDGQALDAGDTVRTDGTGFAEIVYGDGSLTRLGAETVVTVLALDGDTTLPEVELDLDVGRVWNRVRTVTGTRGSFEITTDVGVAAVRGTTFAVACTDEPVCVFTVTEGVVVVRTLDGREIEITAGEVVTLGREVGADGDGPLAGPDGQDGAAGGSDPDGDDPTGDGRDGAPPAGDGLDDAGPTAADGRDDGDPTVGGSSSDERSDAAQATAGDDGASDGPDQDPDAADDGVGAVVELARATLDRAPEQDRSWADRNRPLDAAGKEFDDAQQRCSVTVAGRNLDHADTPATAIEVPIGEELYIDAVATGPLERYAIDLALGGFAVRAAEGVVQPDRSGDRTTFRGEVDVGAYARWGVGLYEVRAATTGTVCSATAYIRVTGRGPLTTATGMLSLLLLLGGAVGLTTVFRRTASPPVASASSAWSTLTRWSRR